MTSRFIKLHLQKAASSADAQPVCSGAAAAAAGTLGVPRRSVTPAARNPRSTRPGSPSVPSEGSVQVWHVRLIPGSLGLCWWVS